MPKKKEIAEDTVVNKMRVSAARARKRVKLSRVKVAEAIGVSKETIERFENGRGFMSEPNLVNLFVFLDLDIKIFQEV
jgi:DNA-binding XRE family transcriptional regulator